nr:MAG TPA: hypothetical protein [Caudoviricetes sp.]
MLIVLIGLLNRILNILIMVLKTKKKEKNLLLRR